MNKEFSKYFDHTLLNPFATRADIERLCHEAKKYNFYAVCVNPLWVNTCYENLKDSDVKVASVVGFPYGANSLSTLVHETTNALADGAEEIDFVPNVGLLKSGEFNHEIQYKAQITCVKEALNAFPTRLDKKLKVILEVGVLTDEELKKAVGFCLDSNVDFLKTSTGVNDKSEAVRSSDMVKRLLELSQGKCLVKASGGIKTAKQSLDLIGAGVSRIGASSSVDIMKEYELLQKQNEDVLQKYNNMLKKYEKDDVLNDSLEL